MKAEEAIEILLDNTFSIRIALAVREGIEALEKQLNNGWILCKERLPKYEDTYYCTVKVKDGIKGMQAGVVTGMECVYVSGIWKNVWFQEISHIFDVIAWQPLPETYKEGEN